MCAIVVGFGKRAVKKRMLQGEGDTTVVSCS